MEKVGRVELQGRSWERYFPLLLILILAFTTGGRFARAADQLDACQIAVGRLVSIQGPVELMRAGQNAWSTVSRLDTRLCAGDKLRTGGLSRAALFIQPETLVRVDQNTTISINESAGEILVEFAPCAVASKTPDEHPPCGAGYFISRFPKKFKVNTPFFNAAVEGTEFMVAVRNDASELSVFDGKVRALMAITREEHLVTNGQVLTAGSAEIPVIQTLIKSPDSVQWVLHYPPLSDDRIEGDTPTAERCRGLSTPSNGTCFAQRAEDLLNFGRTEQALRFIDETLALDSGNGDANALRAIIQIARNDKTAALQSATAATASSPSSYRTWLALSYAQQAAFELEPALAAAQKARLLEPKSSLVSARVAELLLSLGRIKDAESAARSAVDANPMEARGHTVLGFVHLAQIDTRAARADFQAAIDLDSFDPLARLGFGLAIIRDGKLTRGREQLEIAVVLDPANALLRSYVGKAYYEENSRGRDQLASAEFESSKHLDSNDPTPWFYGAILKQTQNRPAEALQDLQTSVEKNDNRAVYRSKFLLDDDAAARTASVAATYGNLGFEKLAIVEGTKALAENMDNYSAHRLLASAYANLPRHDIARVSEALQAQILQPVSVSSVDPQLGTDNLAIVRDTGPSRPGTNEYNLLFNENQTRVQFDGVAGSRDTLADQFLINGLANNIAYSLSQLHYKTDAFVDNNAAEKNIYDVFVHAQVATNASLQVDVKRSDFALGETFFAFDPTFAIPTTISERSDALRLSGHYLGEPGQDWIWTAAAEKRERSIASFPDGFLLYNSTAKPYTAEVQHLTIYDPVQFVSGLGYIDENERFPGDVSIQSRGANAYVYAQWRSKELALTIHAGLAAEWFRSRTSAPGSPDADPIDRNRLSPKVGLEWSPIAGTTLRAAAFSAVRRPFIRSETIEPTQVAGFNQFFTGFEQFYGDVTGTVSHRVGAAIDQAFSPTAFAGIEGTSRRLDVPSSVDGRDYTWREKTAHAYLYKAYVPERVRWPPPGWQVAVSGEIEYEEIERPQVLTGSEGIVERKTTMAPIGVQLFNDFGATLRLATTYIKQHGIFSVDLGLPLIPKREEAWITDFSLEYRLPRRLGAVSVGVRNLFDKPIDLFELDPVNPLVATRRFVFGRIRFTF